MLKIGLLGRNVARQLGDATRLLPFVRPDRTPGATPPATPAHWDDRSSTVAEDAPRPREQHHVHPTDDEARRQDKG